ncbi:YlcI/YnfO family protein [Edwardsiella tarda]
MVTGRSNNKSLQVSVRLPHDVLELIEQVKMTGESTAGFLVESARGEIKRRQRRKSKADTPAE